MLSSSAIGAPNVLVDMIPATNPQHCDEELASGSQFYPRSLLVTLASEAFPSQQTARILTVSMRWLGTTYTLKRLFFGTPQYLSGTCTAYVGCSQSSAAVWRVKPTWYLALSWSREWLLELPEEREGDSSHSSTCPSNTNSRQWRGKVNRGNFVTRLITSLGFCLDSSSFAVGF